METTELLVTVPDVMYLWVDTNFELRTHFRGKKQKHFAYLATCALKEEQISNLLP